MRAHSLEPWECGKNVPSKCHRFIVIHSSVRRRKRNLIRSDATSTRHLKLQPDLQPENTAHIADVGTASRLD